MKQFSLSQLLEVFLLPITILIGIILFVVLQVRMPGSWFPDAIALFVIVLGSIDMVKDTVASLRKKQFVLDYIAILAIVVGIATHQYLVTLIIVLMLAGGSTLEKYGMARAKASLTALTERIPNEVVIWENGKSGEKMAIETIVAGQEVLVRKGEVIPLDGVLVSETALTDESSLTGEPYMFEKVAGDQVRSGTVNTGNAIVIHVTKPDTESTYRKIITMVKEAQAEKAPLLRLADRYSTLFTIVTLLLCAIAYAISRDIERVLAVLVVATPCPLILATPIALFGGMNSAAKRRVLVKKLSSLEVLSRVTAVIFDKTGTITLGRPQVTNLEILDPAYTETRVYSIAEAIERNSLHPFAKAIGNAAARAKAPHLVAHDVNETLGSGIVAVVDGVPYVLAKVSGEGSGMAIELKSTDKRIAIFTFEDTVKDDARPIIERLQKAGMSLHIFTGDKLENAQKVIANLGEAGTHITVAANRTPAEKKHGIGALKDRGEVTAMVGDGINDAPALAFADVGMVFSHEEHTAASEAADVVFLGGDLTTVWETMMIARRTIRIAWQSIVVGIGLSVLCMIFAALGFIPPIIGAMLQEVIDVLVIINALRASR